MVEKKTGGRWELPKKQFVCSTAWDGAGAGQAGSQKIIGCLHRIESDYANMRSKQGHQEQNIVYTQTLVYMSMM